MFKGILMGVGAVAMALTLAFTPSARASTVQYGAIFGANPSYGIDDPSNAGQNGDILIHALDNLQGAQWTWDQSTYNDGTGAYYELILKNDTNGKMCIDDRGGVSGGSIAIKYCNSSASQAWYSTCFWNSGAGVFDETMVDARGKNIHLTSSDAIVLGVLVNWMGGQGDMWEGPTTDFPEPGTSPDC